MCIATGFMIKSSFLYLRDWQEMKKEHAWDWGSGLKTDKSEQSGKEIWNIRKGQDMRNSRRNEYPLTCRSLMIQQVALIWPFPNRWRHSSFVCTSGALAVLHAGTLPLALTPELTGHGGYYGYVNTDLDLGNWGHEPEVISLFSTINFRVSSNKCHPISYWYASRLGLPPELATGPHCHPRIVTFWELCNP